VVQEAATKARPVPLRFGAVAVAVAPTMQLNALVAIVLMAATAPLPIPVLLAQYQAVVAVDHVQRLLPVALAALASASSTSGDSYELRNR
jgi:hypothetical protein